MVYLDSSVSVKSILRDMSKKKSNTPLSTKEPGFVILHMENECTVCANTVENN